MQAGTSRRGRRAIVIIPLLLFLALAALFLFRLGAGDPSRIPSALIGRPAPQTDLPPLEQAAENVLATAIAEANAIADQVAEKLK